MGQVVTEVYIDETGLLVVKYGMCCEKTFDIGGAITDQSEDPVPGSLDPDPIPDDVACRKAYWMGQELTRFMNVMWDEFDGAVIFSWASGVRDAMKAYKLSDWDLLKLYDILQGIFIADSVFPDQWTTIDTQRLTCLYVPHLNGVDYTLTREEYDAIKSATGNVGNIAMEVFIKSAFDALNYSNFQRMAAFAQDITVPAGSCDCPDSVEALPDWTTEGDWYVILDYQGQTPLHTVLGDDNGITVITSRGAELQADTPGSDKVSVRWDPPVDTGTIQRVRIEMLMNDVHGSGNEWVGLGLHGPMGNYRQGDIVYTDGIGVLEDTTLDVFPVEFFVTAELNAQTAENPIAPVFTRIILQGIGDHPLGL